MKNQAKIFAKVASILMVVLLLLITTTFSYGSTYAQGQETCPEGGYWIKADGLNGTSYTFNAPAGKLIAETCYKAAIQVIYKTINPPQASVTVISTVGHDLSHASFRLTDDSEPTPTEPTPTEPTPTEPTPTQPTPTPTTPTPTPEIDVDPLNLSGICNEGVSITWRVSNRNNFDLAYSWTANNGASGSGIVIANGSSSFSTSSDAYQISMKYAVKIDPMEVQASVEGCKPQNETPVPTKETTAQPTGEPSSEPTEEAVTKVDPQPDQPAGGSGPSLLSLFAPLGMISLVTTIGLVALKRIQIKTRFQD